MQGSTCLSCCYAICYTFADEHHMGYTALDMHHEQMAMAYNQVDKRFY